ncbi:RrF2 family transcriptional regulator [Christiangramia sediminis]|uniref:Rrf2 family transcriptional regulator n=1 Tax=Christiangramia sediminis TaxID=2881336 RepID=A0A9X1LKM9_9FLAO|nr:Rrf2 family transcriptional regulator [Christiangramia sediminis]MCB7482098.1 Rrf2 family transcriptional regulator [Christiangramia sediminis]
MFSKACEYGIRASLFIARGSKKERRTSLKEIAAAINSPEAFTAKILQKLVQQDIINSAKGPQGGFFITPENQTLVLADIVKAIDGDAIMTGCALGLEKCSEDHPCPIHFDFAEIRNNLKKMLEKTTILELTSRLDSGLGFLKV